MSETKTREYIFLTAGSSTTTEEYYLTSDGSDRTPKLFLPREQDVRYSILSHREKFFIYYKDKASLNGMVYVTDKDKVQDRSAWKLFVSHRTEVRLDSIGVYASHVALEERQDGLTQIRILLSKGSRVGQFTSPNLSIPSASRGIPPTKLRRYAIATHPQIAPLRSTNMIWSSGRVVSSSSRRSVGGFSPEDYTVERLWATAPDGVRVPDDAALSEGTAA